MKPTGPELDCVEPSVGDRILELLDENLGAEDRRLLEAHRHVCAQCRLVLDLERGFAEALGEPSLDSDGPRVVGVIGRRVWAGWAAVAAIAASLVLMFGLPPRPVGSTVASRGSEQVGFVAPVEGEVVAADGFRLRWRPVQGAASYRVRIGGLEEGTLWTGTSSRPELAVPAEVELTEGAEYRALLSTVPEDLLPAGGRSVTFRTGSRREILTHRASHARPVAYVLALTALALGVFFAFGRRP